MILFLQMFYTHTPEEEKARFYLFYYFVRLPAALRSCEIFFWRGWAVVLNFNLFSPLLSLILENLHELLENVKKKYFLTFLRGCCAVR